MSGSETLVRFSSGYKLSLADAFAAALGIVGRATLIGLSEDELDELRKRFT